MEDGKLTCPKCAGAMNHHADKIVYLPAVPAARAAQNPFGGIVEETHACPACGAIETRCADSAMPGEAR